MTTRAPSKTRAESQRKNWKTIPAAERADRTAAARKVSLPKRAAASTLIAAAVDAIEGAGGRVEWTAEP